MLSSAWEKGVRVQVLLVLAAMVFSTLPFLPFYLDHNNVLIYRDLAETDLPAKSYWADTVRTEHRIPRWNSYQGGGAPYYADPVAAPLHPLNSVFLLFPREKYPQALTVFVLLHYALMYLGYFLFFRRIRIGFYLSLCVGLVGVWSGFSLSVHCLTHMLVSATVLPWFAWCWIKAKREGSLLSLVGTSFFLAAPILGGDPQFAFFLGLATGLHALFGEKPGRSLARLGTVSALALLCAAAQLLPSRELLLQSARVSSGQGPLFDSGVWALSFRRLGELLIPDMLGRKGDADHFLGLDETYLRQASWFISSIYLGAVSVLLLTWAFVSGFAWRYLRRRGWLLSCGGTTLLFIWLCMGSHAPVDLFAVGIKIFPFGEGFRYPERFSILFIFPLLAGSAKGLRALQCLAQLRGPAAVSKALAAPFLLLSLACLGLGLYYAPRINSWQPFLLSGIFLTGAAGVLIAAGLKRSHRAALLLLPLMITADLNSVSREKMDFYNSSLTKTETYPVLVRIKNDRQQRARERQEGGADRFVSLNGRGSWRRVSPKDGDWDPMSYSELARWEGLNGNLATWFRLPSAQEHYSIPLLTKALQMRSFSDKNFQFYLDLVGVRYEIVHGKMGPPEIKVNEDALPNFYFARSFELEPSTEALLEKLPALSWKQLPVALEGPAPAATPGESESLKASLRGRDSGSVTFEIAAARAVAHAIFVSNETFYPPWRAEIDGRPVPVRPANGWARAVALENLEAGIHKLYFYYDNRMIRRGQLLSGAWCLALALALLLSGRRRSNSI